MRSRIPCLAHGASLRSKITGEEDLDACVLGGWDTGGRRHVFIDYVDYVDYVIHMIIYIHDHDSLIP
jgi:hypothetical protein